MGMLDISIVKKYIRMADDGWHQGWHERNGGNLTYRLKAEEVAEMQPFFDAEPRPWVNMGVTGENLAGEYFLSTGSGKFFRNVITDPEDSICVVEINAAGDSYRIRWGLKNGGKPTSEFPSHYMNHCVRAKATNGEHRVIYHAHPANIIAMTFVLPLTDRDFSRALWKSATECPVVFPGGVGVVPWMVPGGADIALATCKKMEEFDAAVWAHHGLFASGPDFDITFGLMHTIEKAAEIWVLQKSTGLPELQTIQDNELRAIARDFKVALRESFLD
ncbi:MAG: rhamnulose-1-phosphate aldolase [Clostridiales bacterium]|nr:rhamnulose-1-phosphate aldolase [Clostridiales bacterium]